MGVKGNNGSNRQSKRLKKILWWLLVIGFIGAVVVRRNGLDLTVISTTSYSASAFRGLRSTEARDEAWSPIHVYVGDPAYLEPKNAGFPHYSQSGQDKFVLELLDNKRNGYFIDLAANDPIELSNTAWLEQENDWKGLCVEPNPAYWYRLAHRKCQIVGALVGKNEKERLDVRFDNGVKGGIVSGNKFDNKALKSDASNKANAESTTPSIVEKRYTATVQGIFNKFNVPHVIDYLSLDVEGAEYFVLEDFPFDDYMIRIISIERPQPQLQNLLRKNKYVMIRLISGFGETLWVHQSMMQNRATKKVMDLKHACWDYEKRRGCDLEYWRNNLVKKEAAKAAKKNKQRKQQKNMKQ